MTSGSRGTNGTDGTKDSGVTQKRSRRGIVNMLKVKRARSKGIVKKVNWNELGQPIGEESMTLVHFIGSFARRNIPITCDDWRKKEFQNVKQNLWDEVKETFHGVGDEHRKKIVSRAGSLHRQFRTRLRSLGSDSNGNYSAKPPDLYAHLSTVGPYWNQFVESSMTEDFKEKSKKNKEQAKAMEARYKKACVGYARIREIIIKKKIEAGEENPIVSRLDAWEYARQNENGVISDPVTLQVLEDVVTISEHLAEHELTNIGTDDLLARLIPLEYSGRVRGIGWGVTKTSLQKASTTSEISKLKKDVSYLINEIKLLKSKGSNPGIQSGGSSHMDNFDPNDKVDGQLDDLDHVLGEELPEGKNACYLYLDPGRRYVGRGILHNDLTDRILHAVPLEDGFVKVQFEVAEKSEYDAPLPRPCDEANTVGQAPGHFLAWPRKNVSTKLETPPKNMNKKKKKKMHDMGHEKIKDKVKEKTVESGVDVYSRQLGYPLREDTCHDGVLDFVRLAIVFNRVTDIEVDMGVLYWNVDPWKDHIHKENVLEVLDSQWLSASSLVFYIRYLCEVYLSKNPDLAAKFSFVSPHLVSPLVSSSETSLAKCLLGHIDQDHLLLVPYNVSKHWILVAINVKTETIYFMDPARTHNKKEYTMTAFPVFTWTNVQVIIFFSFVDLLYILVLEIAIYIYGIFCGYYVGCFIEDILSTGEKNMNVNFSYSSGSESYSLDKMIHFQKNWGGYLYNRFLKDKLLIK